jgi:hypothetical protein
MHRKNPEPIVNEPDCAGSPVKTKTAEKLALLRGLDFENPSNRGNLGGIFFSV